MHIVTCSSDWLSPRLSWLAPHLRKLFKIWSMCRMPHLFTKRFEIHLPPALVHHRTNFRRSHPPFRLPLKNLPRYENNANLGGTLYCDRLIPNPLALNWDKARHFSQWKALVSRHGERLFTAHTMKSANLQCPEFRRNYRHAAVKKSQERRAILATGSNTKEHGWAPINCEAR